MDIQELILTKVSEEKEKFLLSNDCEKCKNLPDGRFCSKEHYYRTIFDFRSSYIKNSVLLATEYFGISKDKEEEFLQFLQSLVDIYY